MRKFLIIVLLLLIATSIWADNLYTVHNPTAGQLDRGEARLHQKMFKNNGIFLGADVGLFEVFQFGVAYGAENVVGDKQPEYLNRVEFKARFRIINESFALPAFSLGVDTQGHGHYYKKEKRYDIMSKGAYLVASKNFKFLGLMGFDGGMNYTFENVDNGETRFDIFLGMYKTIGDVVTVYADWSAGINDDKRESATIHDVSAIGKGRTYLNTGVQVQVTENLALKLLMHDMFRNRDGNELFDRSLILDYRWHF